MKSYWYADVIPCILAEFISPLFCPVPSQENSRYYLIDRFCVCYITVCCLLHFSVMLFRCFPLIVDVFLSVLVCNPNLFSLNRFMTFEQRYSSVALIYVEIVCQNQQILPGELIDD